MRDFDEYLLDAFENQEDLRPIEGAEPVDTTVPVPAEVRRRFFTDQIYPYASRITLREYYEQKYRLQVELVKFQNWVKDTG